MVATGVIIPWREKIRELVKDKSYQHKGRGAKTNDGTEMVMEVRKQTFGAEKPRKETLPS